MSSPRFLRAGVDPGFKKALVGVLILLVLALGPMTGEGLAQTLQTGSIVGKVSDNSGGRAAAVSVTLTSPVLLTPRTTKTDSEGVYRFVSLPPGPYALAFELQGFRKTTKSNIPVDVASTRTVDITLEVGVLNETLEVVSETSPVDITKTNLATNIDTDALQKIPTGRDPWAILQNMAPQVVLDREDVGGSQSGLQAVFSSNCSTWRQNTYAFNGVNVTDPAATGAAGFYYDFDSF